MTTTANASYNPGSSLVRKLENARKQFNANCESHIEHARCEAELLSAGIDPTSVWSGDASWWFSFLDDTTAAADKMRELIPVVGEFDEPSKSLCGKYSKLSLPADADKDADWLLYTRRPKDTRFDFVVVAFMVKYVPDSGPCKIVEETTTRKSLVCEASS